MTIPLAIGVAVWAGLVPALIVWLRLRRVATIGEWVEAGIVIRREPAFRRVGNSTDACQRRRVARVASMATHVDSRRARDRFGLASGGCPERQ